MLLNFKNVNVKRPGTEFSIYGDRYPQHSSMQSSRQMTTRTTSTRDRVRGIMFSSEPAAPATDTDIFLN